MTNATGDNGGSIVYVDGTPIVVDPNGNYYYLEDGTSTQPSPAAAAFVGLLALFSGAGFLKSFSEIAAILSAYNDYKAGTAQDNPDALAKVQSYFDGASALIGGVDILTLIGEFATLAEFTGIGGAIVGVSQAAIAEEQYENSYQLYLNAADGSAEQFQDLNDALNALATMYGGLGAAGSVIAGFMAEIPELEALAGVLVPFWGFIAMAGILASIALSPQAEAAEKSALAYLVNKLSALYKALSGATASALNHLHLGGTQIDPLILDLTGKGINLTNVATSSTFFDFLGDGFAQQTAWVGAGNGMLVLAPSGANAVSASQLISSFAQLQQMAGGVQTLNSLNPLFQQLRVWVDANSDGIAEPGELFSLSQLGIASINLEATSVNEVVAGNTIDAIGSFTLTDGATFEIAAASLQQDPTNTVPDTTVVIPSNIASLPQLAGSGLMLDLQSEMVEDPQLAKLVESFVALPSGTAASVIESDVIEIMYQWAGVQSVDPSSRGSDVDARQLEFVEQYLGESFDGVNGSDPIYHAAPEVNAAWNDLYNAVLTELVLQSPNAASLLPEFTYDALNGTVLPILGFQSLQDVYTRLGSPTESNIGQWDVALRAFETYRVELGMPTGDYNTVVAGLVSDEIGSLANAIASNFQISIDQNGNITETGTALNDIFYAGQGIVKAIGDGGGETFDDPAPLFDTFVFNQGDGSFEINELDGLATTAATNTLQLGTGITEASLTAKASADGKSLILTDGIAGDVITIDDMLIAGERQTVQVLSSLLGGTEIDPDMDGVQEIQFADGTTISAAQLIDLETTGTSGNDTLLGGGVGGNLFDGKGGNDLEIGAGNGDTFVFDQGYGHLEIDEGGSVYATNLANVLQLGAGITAASLVVKATADGTGLVLTDGVSGDEITIDEELTGGAVDVPGQPGIQEIQFADGTTMSAAQLIDLETTGTSGNDTLYGSAIGNELFDGKGGNDLEIANGSGDTFVFNEGYGHLQIDADADAPGTLQLGAGITEASLAAKLSGDGSSLILTDGIAGDQITLNGALGSAIPEIEFADGTTMSTVQLIDLETTGTTGNDTLLGGSTGGNLFDGKGGNDLEVGNGNGDTFVFNQGYGHLEIDESNTYNTSADLDGNVLQLGAGITAASLIVKATADRSGLVLTDGVAGDQITIDNMLQQEFTADGIQEIQFADGTTMSATQLVDLETIGTHGADTLYGGVGGGNLFDGNGGNDLEIGKGNGDTFVFNQGYGQLDINEDDFDHGLDVLQLGSGITEALLVVTASADGKSLIVTDGIAGDQITLGNMLSASNQGTSGIEQVEFADGTTMSGAQLVDLETTGTTGNDTLYGGASGGNLFDGQGGNDLEVGHGNGDTFVFNQGYGQLEINETDRSTNPSDVLQLGSGITEASLVVTVSADSKSLVLTDGVSGDVITIDNMLDPESGTTGVQEIEFADGTTMSTSQWSNLETIGTSGNDTLRGGAQGDNLFDGKGGNDVAIGNGNEDTFVFNQGYGHLEIDERDDSNNQDNVLLLGPGITASSLTATWDASGSNLILRDGVEGDQITIDNEAELAFDDDSVQEIQFADGTTMSNEQFIQLGTTGTSGNDTLSGQIFGGSVFDGKGGSDKEISINGDGNSTFVFNQGYGHLEIDAETAGDVLSLGAGLTAASLIVTASADGSSLVLTDGIAGDQITIDNMLGSYEAGTISGGITEVQFADGTTMSAQQLVGMETVGTSGNDKLYGSYGSDLLDGKGGNDLEIGNGGNDTFVFNEGYGRLEIDEVYEGSDGFEPEFPVLQLGPGITEDSLVVKESVSVLNGKTVTNIVLTDGISGDEITLDGMVAGLNGSDGGPAGVAEVQFADGTTMSAQQLLDLATIGTSGNDTLSGGTVTGSLFDGEGGNDLEIGYTGANGDTFVFNQGYGHLEIEENKANWIDGNFYFGGQDILQLGAGITAASLSVKESADGSALVLTDGVAGDQITIDNMQDTYLSFYDPLPADPPIDEIEFADGTTMSATQLVNLATTGTSGNDTLYGETVGGDLFDGRGGDDLEVAHGDNNTFVFNQGYGHLEIDSMAFFGNASPDNVLQLGAGITAASLTVEATADGTGLILTDGIAGDQITIDGILVPEPGGDGAAIQEVEFADGTTMSASQLVDLETTGTTGNDTLYGGTTGGNLFDGKGGNDLEMGDGHDNTYVFNQGYGHLEIETLAYNRQPGLNNFLQLGAGITAASLTVEATADGTGLILTDGIAGDQITLDGMLVPQNAGGFLDIQGIIFADGTTMSVAQLMLMETTGTGGDNTLYGTTGADVFDGKGGSDVEIGNGGGDTFIFDQGYGRLEINENDTNFYANNVLQLGAGITEASLIVTESADGKSLVLTDGVAGDQVTIDDLLLGQTQSGTEGIQKVQFADGTTLSAAQLIDLGTTGTSANDTLHGGATGGNLFDGKGGNDVEVGNGYGDTFVFNQGYGHLEIDETDTSGDADNTLQLGSGISVNSLTVTVTADRTGLVLGDGTVGDQIVLDNILTQGNGGTPGIEEVTFANGTTISVAQLVDMETVGTSGNDTLYGGATGGNLFDGKGGTDLAIGHGNGDTFIFNQGYGSLEIDEDDPDSGSPDNVLQLGVGITEASLTVRASTDGTSLLLFDGATGDQIKIDNILTAADDGTPGVESIEFADGTTLSAAQLVDLETIGSSGSNTLSGGATGGNLFDGKGGGDRAIGHGNGDTFIFNQGYGALEIDESDATSKPNNILKLGAGITEALLTVKASADGDSLVVTDGTAGDQITIDNILFSATDGIQNIEFADGSTISVTQLVDLETTGTSANDTLRGGATGDNLFDGKGGNDLDIGNGNGDTFVFNQGYGHLEIDESNTYNTSADLDGNVLQLGAGITAASLVVKSTADGSGLVLTDGTSGDQITLDNMLITTGTWSAAAGIQEIQFADGTTMSAAQLIQQEMTGTTGADTLAGTAGPNLFDGKGGNDLEIGNGGNATGQNSNYDTFVFNQGYGHLEIRENDPNFGENVLQLGAGITEASLVGTTSADGESLVLTDGVAGDQITIDNMLSGLTNGAPGIEEVEFADGSTMSAGQLVDLETTGTPGTDTLLGGAFGSNLFDGKGGNDVEVGNGYGDTFVFNQGYGHLEIDEADSSGDADNTLRLGSGISVASLTVTVTADGTGLVLGDGTAGDQITIDNMLVQGSTIDGTQEVDGIQEVTFADGTTLSASQLITMSGAVANALTGTLGADTLTGTSGKEIFDGEGGNDVEIGNGGSDTFVFNPGYGDLEINENYAAGGVPVLRLGPGISQASLSAEVGPNGSLVLTDGIAGDQITLDNMLSQNNQGVAQVEFIDGSVLTAGQLIAMAATITGTTGADTLTGTSGDDIVDGKGGGDTEIGDGGNDTYILKANYGALTIENGVASNNAANGTLSILNESPDDIWLTQVGNNLQIDVMGTTTEATIQGWFSNSYNQLNSITTTDATGTTSVLDSQLSQLVQAMATYSAQNPGFDPTSVANPSITDPTLLALANSSYHH
jgi:Ca2+-binding RTX toxin-like protein